MTTSAKVPASTDWYMAGTERTGAYLVIARNTAGRIGVRVLDGYVRVRIEPSGPSNVDVLAKHFTVGDGWKQPDFTKCRFSRVLSGDTIVREIEAAIASLQKEGKLTRQSAVRLWRKTVTA